MGYATPADVAALIKDLDSYTTVDEAEVARVLNEANVQVDNMLANYYRAPLTIVPTQAEFLTTIKTATSVAAGDTACTLTATSLTSAPQDGRAVALQANTAIYFEPGTPRQERAVIDDLDTASGVCELVFPIGHSPIIRLGLIYPHAAGSTVITSRSLDALYVAATRLAMANLTEAYYAGSDEHGTTQVPNIWRQTAMAIMNDIASGARQFYDSVSGANRPLYPAGEALGTELNWDGVTPGAPGHATFVKEHAPFFIPGEHT